VLEFLHRLVDVLEDFLGAPLLASKVEGSYDIVAQLLGEMCDAGSVCNTEPNALRDVVDVPKWVDRLLGGVGLPRYGAYSTPDSILVLMRFLTIAPLPLRWQQAA
jgi:AP-3 complex subunit mu